MHFFTATATFAQAPKIEIADVYNVADLIGRGEARA